MDENGFTALHSVCCDVNIPVDIVRVLLKAFPEAALTKNKEGLTPLALSVLNHNVDVARILIKHAPDTVSIADNKGLTPLHWAALSAIYLTEIMDTILEFGYAAVLDEDCNGETPADYFFKAWNMHVRAFLCKNIARNSPEEILAMDIMSDVKIKDIYEKTCLFLRAVEKSTSKTKTSDADTSSWLAVHSSLRFNSCPWAFSALLIRIHPQQLTKMDDHGNIPIHIIAAAASKSIDSKFFICHRCGIHSELLYHAYDTIFSDLCQACFDSLGINDQDEVLLKPAFKVPSVVQEILAIKPQAASIPNEKGNYPLHIALKHQNNLGVIEQLFYAAPDIGMKFDLDTGLLPFMAAADKTWVDEREQLNTIYFLIREDPSLVASGSF